MIFNPEKCSHKVYTKCLSLGLHRVSDKIKDGLKSPTSVSLLWIPAHFFLHQEKLGTSFSLSAC